MAAKKARHYTQSTLKKLYGRAGNRCAFPGCDVELLPADSDTNLSEICHIEDANPNVFRPDRYNPNMSDDERRDYKNLILLCRNHHKATDDPECHSADELRKMKRDHEDFIREQTVKSNSIAKHPSLLGKVVKILGKERFFTEDGDLKLIAPDPEAKIAYNSIVRFRYLIEGLRIYQGKLNKIYEEIEKEGTSTKDVLLLNIHSIYLKEKSKYRGLQAIKANSDTIIEEIFNVLSARVDTQLGVDYALSEEIIENAINIILVDAFLRCKILEEPINDPEP